MPHAATPYRILGKSALTALLVAFCVSGAQAQNAANGKRIADRWCSSCHVVDPNDNRPVRDTVPSFTAVANNSSTTRMGLAAFLTTPHYTMPNFVLSRGEIADVSAYIMSLRKPR